MALLFKMAVFTQGRRVLIDGWVMYGYFYVLAELGLLFNCFFSVLVVIVANALYMFAILWSYASISDSLC